MMIDERAFIRKVDMNNIKHSLFLGNQACCCTAIGIGGRAGSAPEYIMNKFIQAIELIVDGTAVGNTMCYLANVNNKHFHPKNGVPTQNKLLNNELSLFLDNIEVLTPYRDDPKYLDVFIKYARKLARDIGAENIPIYAGHRNKFDMRDFSKVHLHNLYVLGDSGYRNISIDSLENQFATGEAISSYNAYYGDFYDLNLGREDEN